MKRRGLWKWLSIAFSLFVATAAIGVSFIDVGYAATSGTVDGWNENATGIGLSYSGTADNAWTSANSIVTGTAKSVGGTCSDTHYETTLTITCNKSGTLSFEYAIDLQGGTIKVNNNAVQGDGVLTQECQKGQTIPIYLKSNSTASPTKITIRNMKLQLPASPAIIRFESNSLCSYEAYVNGVPCALSTNVDCETGDTVVVQSPKPVAGYDFVGWKVDEELCGNNNSYTFLVVNSNTTVEVLAIDENAAIFDVEQKPFYDLQSAIDYANTTKTKIVRLFKSGQILPKGDGSDYIFSNGVNLFVPGSANSVYSEYAKKEPRIEQAKATVKHDYVLKLLESVKIRVKTGSAICIAGDMYYAGGGSLTSLPTGAVGEINLSTNSTITLESGSNFYCWGYASGNGEIHALNGSTVYEGFSFLFRGGSASTNMGKVFVFSQYYIQNIEAHLFVYSGATEKTTIAVTALRQYKSQTFTFIGQGGMFTLQEGSYIVKYYDPIRDRLSVRVVGSGTLSHLKVSVSILTIDSTDYNLPICNNLDIAVAGGTVTLEQDLDFLPGASLEISTGAKAVLGSGRKVFFYDLSNWKGKGYGCLDSSDLMRIEYVSLNATEAFKKANRQVTSGSFLKLNGEFENSGGLYMTKPTSDSALKPSELGRVISDGGGKFTYLTKAYDSSESITSVTTPQYNQQTKNITEIPVTPAVFSNSDDSAFSGKCPIGAALAYENGFWKVQHQGPYDITITFKAPDEATVIGTKTYTIDGSGIELPNQTEFTGFQGSIFLWLVAADKTVSYEPYTNIKTIREDIVLVAFTGGWYKDRNKDTFYYDRTLGKIKGLRYIDAEGTRPENLYCFDENGHLLTGAGEFFTFEEGAKYNGGGDGNIYYVDDGVVQNKGFASLGVPVGDSVMTYYYYFGPSHYAYRNTTCYINTNLNNLLPEGVYTFGNDGRVEALECSNFTGVDSVTLSADGYCTFDTIKAGIGLFVSDTHIYYAKDDGSIMKNGTYYVEEGKRNGKVTEAGLYYFDTNGYLCDSLMNPITVTPPEANA